MPLTEAELASVPPAVRAQAEAIEAAVNQAATEDAPAAPDAQAVQEAPKPDGNTPDAATVASEAPTTAQEGTPPTQVPQHEGIRTERTLERAEQALRVLQGKYNAELPRLQRQLREQATELERLKAQPAPEPQEPADPGNPYGLTEAEQEYGEELTGIAEKIGRRIASEAVTNAVKPLMERLAGYEADKDKSAFDRFESALTERIPEWQRINTEESFSDWLQETHPGTGRTRKELIDEAADSADANRAAYFFEQYLVESGQQPSAASASIAEQVAPKRGAGSPEPAKRRYTIEEWAQENVKLTSGAYTPEQAQKVNAELVAAMEEHRVG